MVGYRGLLFLCKKRNVEGCIIQRYYARLYGCNYISPLRAHKSRRANAFDYFDPSNGYLKLKDGVISGTAGTDGVREGLKYIAGLYADGLIDPAALTQDESQLSALGTKEEVICGTAACGHIGMFVDINDIQRSAAYDNLLPLEGPDGYRGIDQD